jgi:hypothetical protein
MEPVLAFEVALSCSLLLARARDLSLSVGVCFFILSPHLVLGDFKTQGDFLKSPAKIAF